MKMLNEIVEEIKCSLIPYYVYVLYSPDLVPFYVGKGTRSAISKSHHERIDWHEYEASCNKPKNLLKVRTIQKIWEKGQRVQYAIDSWHIDEIDAYSREKDLISKLGRKVVGTGTLTNLTEGGEKETAELTPETKQKISASLKRYYEENPEAVELNSENRLKYYEGNPKAAERARQNAIENNTAECLARWRKEKPEEFVAHMAAHSGRMKKWYAENPEAAKKMAATRNVVLRSDSHRKKMSEKTRLYNKSHQDENRKRRQKANKSLQITVAEHNRVKQQCLRVVHDTLVSMGLIKPRKREISMSMVSNWRRKGWVDKYFPNLPFGYVKVEVWKEFLDTIR